MKLTTVLFFSLSEMAISLSAPSLTIHPPRSTPSSSTTKKVAETIKSNGKMKDFDDKVTTAFAPWRIVLDIGREPLASTMPFDWNRSGCRMSLVIPCDFMSDNTVIPRSDTVSFTGPDGAVVRPILGGEWELSNNQKTIHVTLTFPECMERKDVWIDAGTTICLEGSVFTQTELNRLNDEFYKARDETWRIGGELNELSRRQGAPKKWNEQTQQWEKRYNDGPLETLFSQVEKRARLWGAQAKQQQKNQQRPNPKTLSQQGPFPAIDGDDNVYFQNGGYIRIQSNGQGTNSPVIGRWSIEPITKLPISSYSSEPVIDRRRVSTDL